jgi:hypothetical protein
MPPKGTPGIYAGEDVSRARKGRMGSWAAPIGIGTGLLAGAAATSHDAGLGLGWAIGHGLAGIGAGVILGGVFFCLREAWRSRKMPDRRDHPPG